MDDQTKGDVVKFGVWCVVLIIFIITLLGVGFGFQIFTEAGNFSLRHIFLGTDQLTDLDVTGGNLETVGLLITSIMLWLIVFFAFGDILENFSAFSNGISWIVAFGVSVIGANVKLFNMVLVQVIGWFAVFGTFAVGVAMLGAFVAFVLVNLGIRRASGWIENRQHMVKAASGKTKLRTGIGAIKEVAEATADDEN